MAQRYEDRDRGERSGGERGGRRSDDLYRRDYGPYDRGWASEGRPTGRGYGGETGRDTSWSGPSSGAYSQYSSRAVPTFAGRGPKGYQRSDDRIREDVCDRLTQAGDVDASEIEVTVNNGEVTLSGAVRGRDQKRRSEDVAESVAGIREVHNNLRVSR